MFCTGRELLIIFYQSLLVEKKCRNGLKLGTKKIFSCSIKVYQVNCPNVIICSLDSFTCQLQLYFRNAAQTRTQALPTIIYSSIGIWRQWHFYQLVCTLYLPAIISGNFNKIILQIFICIFFRDLDRTLVHFTQEPS